MNGTDLDNGSIQSDVTRARLSRHRWPTDAVTPNMLNRQDNPMMILF